MPPLSFTICSSLKSFSVIRIKGIFFVFSSALTCLTRSSPDPESGIIRLTIMRSGFVRFRASMASRLFAAAVSSTSASPRKPAMSSLVAWSGSTMSTFLIRVSFSRFFNLFSKTFLLIGLTMYSAAPRLKPLFLSSTIERMMTGISWVAGVLFSSCRTCQPSLPGIMISRVMAAGRISRALSTAFSLSIRPITL
ncbi:hypothetical protein BMS3Abin13_00556 [bacterium BMS3Abin13]|nr:hypothetical protein BMS3Abin13_00556 [bacterium BMS3Abin13]